MRGENEKCIQDFDGKSVGKRPLGRLWEDMIKMIISNGV
jgi:hypothetical protein